MVSRTVASILIPLSTLAILLTGGCSSNPPVPPVPQVPQVPQVPSEAAETTLRVIAGDGSTGFIDGTDARFHKPIRLAPFGEDAVVLADIYNHAIRVVHVDGRVETLAGGPDRKGHRDGPAEEARFASPHGVAVSSAGVIAVAEAENHTIRLLTPSVGENGTRRYTVSTLAGRPGESGMHDGPVGGALFNSPHAVQWTAEGGLLVVDIGNASLRLILDGEVRTLAGSDAGFIYPMDIALEPSGGVVIADAGSHQLWRWSPGGEVTALQLDAPLSTPHGVSVAPDGTIYVADMRSHRILAVDAGGHVTPLCGTGEAGAAPDQLSRPAAVLAHGGRIWIADLDNHQIKVWTLR
jgi:DNA-binding beta-propeller fold protein YncE